MAATHPLPALHREGTGTPLLLLHGIGHRHQAWQPLLPLLTPHHDVIAVDLPGFGMSPPLPRAPGERPSIPSATAGIAGLIADLGLTRPHVAGNSLGGALALELAATGAVASATALSPGGFWAHRWEVAWGLGNLRLARFGCYAPRPMLRYITGHATTRAVAFGMIFGRPRALDPELAYGDMLAMRAGADFRAVAREAKHYHFTPAAESAAGSVPTTIAWGTKDRILLRRQFARAQALLPAARFEDLPGCGHVPMNDDPARVARLILETTGAVPRS